MEDDTIVAEQPVQTPLGLHETPRFSRLLNTVLGSPFVTVSDLPHDDAGNRLDGRTAHADLEAVDGAFAAVPRAHTITRPPSPTPSFSTDTYSFLNWSEQNVDASSGLPRSSLSDAAPMCSFLHHPSRRPTTSHGPSLHSAPTPYSTLRSAHYNSLRSARANPGLFPRLWDVLRDSSPAKKCRRRGDGYGAWQDPESGEGCIDYANMPPLDGEEGELVDDEACFINATAITGIDIVAHIPEELALYLFSFLDLQDVLSCYFVSKVWKRLASDNSTWRSLFMHRRADGWGIDLRRVHRSSNTAAARFASAHSSAHRPRTILAPLELDWYNVYKTRTELEYRWSGQAVVGSVPEDKENAKAWEPCVRRLEGHRDSVYCTEFDSARIITGSRDRTIKIWSLKTGRCLATIKGHRGSVLCLKFEKDWDLDPNNAVTEPGLTDWRRGFMVSGSSDHNVCVWDLFACTTSGHERGGLDVTITAELRGVLRGHRGGVLDLETNANWIVSCSKDAHIRVWKRSTLEVFRTLDGHEGPVNALGLQGNRVVSASGDGKLMLWDIVTGERIRTFEGHDRGLACIEFKDDLIVSGSNDKKIKIWDANTGECRRTLAGHDNLVRALAFDPLSGRLVSGSYDRTVKVWDWRTGKMVRQFRGQYGSHIFDVKFDCSRIVSTSHDHTIVIFDFAEGLDASLLK